MQIDVYLMQIERRALYNSLRMNWVMDPTLEVEPWQVEDYRSLPIDTIFERIEEKNIPLDKETFLALAENVDTPETHRSPPGRFARRFFVTGSNLSVSF
jgi:hypothetical protein